MLEANQLDWMGWDGMALELESMSTMVVDVCLLLYCYRLYK
jgi:hypothetical protein